MTRSERIQDFRRRIAGARQIVTEADDRLLAELAQMASRLETASSDFTIANVVSQKTGEGRLDISWLGTLTQIDVTKAREIGWMFLEAASVAESEAGLMRFLQEEIGITVDKAATLLGAFRRYREQEAAKNRPH